MNFKKYRPPMRNLPAVNSDLYQKTVNDKDQRKKLLGELIELNTIRWTKEHPFKGMYVNRRYTWNTKHPYIKNFLKNKLVVLKRDNFFLGSSRTIMTYKEIIVATKYITEVLKEINAKPDLLFEGEYKKYGDGGPLGVVFRHAFTKRERFILPNGTPPFKESPEPLGMTPGQFIREVRKFHYFTNATLSPMKRESLFVQLCESIHPDEAKILIAVKDQKLTELYPNITAEVVAEAGFIDPKDIIQYTAPSVEPTPVPKKIDKRFGPRPKKVKETGKLETPQEGQSPVI